jgi:hypothetical protein
VEPIEFRKRERRRSRPQQADRNRFVSRRPHQLAAVGPRRSISRAP